MAITSGRNTGKCGCIHRNPQGLSHDDEIFISDLIHLYLGCWPGGYEKENRRRTRYFCLCPITEVSEEFAFLQHGLSFAWGTVGYGRTCRGNPPPYPHGGTEIAPLENGLSKSRMFTSAPLAHSGCL